VFTEPLHSYEKGLTYRHTDWWEGFRKYAAEVVSEATINTPYFIKTGSGLLKLIGEYADIQTALRSNKPTLIFLK
jgi:hypothetical protein